MRAYLQLVRLPAVFTAMADIFMGYLLTHESLERWTHFVLLLIASALIYLAGMVLNDYFDAEQDARERPERPIPSGRVSRGSAGRLGFGLLATGLLAAWIASSVAEDGRPRVAGTLLAGAVLAYDAGLKRTPLAPLAMGVCRLLNVRLGMSLSHDPTQAVGWVVACGVGLYIVGVTLFARREAHAGGRARLIAGTCIALAAILLLNQLGRWITGLEVPPIRIPLRWHVFWGALAVLVGWRMVRAIARPTPAHIQSAVTNCLVMLIVIDAGVTLAVQDRLWGLAVLALTIPSLWLGRWIYST